MSTAHVPVLVDEVVSTLITRPNGYYLDATFGGGGHTQALLRHLSPSATVLVTDRDPVAISSAEQLASFDPRVSYDTAKFSELEQVSAKHAIEHFDGILMDIGVSSMQLDNQVRGFSFQQDGPLDMRMDATQGMTAAEWLNRAETRDISHILKRYGEERNAPRIAKAIVANRPLTSTFQLVRIIDRAVRVHDSRKHPATRVFQALRIHINDELNELKRGLRAVGRLLAISGRLIVISFHSLEHRIVREQFLEWSAVQYPPKVPVPGTQTRPMKIIEKGVRASNREFQTNNRARSALMQVIERVY